MMMKGTNMTIDEFDALFDIHDDLHDKYMEYIMENADPEECMICDGDSLIVASESGYLFEEFYNHCMKIGIENI